MRILLVAATKAEIKPVINWVASGHLDILITGAGMVATAFHLGRKLGSEEPYDLILNAGVAGALDRSLALGTVVNVVEDHIFELGAEDGEEWLSIEKLNLGISTYHSYFPHKEPLIDQLPPCKGITVNRVHGRENSIQRIASLVPDARVESMEGAAVFYAAQYEQTPVIQIRSISNYVERRNRLAWDMPLAIQNLNLWLGDFIAAKVQ